MKIPAVKEWQLIAEERVTVNREWKSGLVKRFFVDPKHRLGLGATVSAFYRDDSELLLAIHWRVGTHKAQEAYRTPKNTWYVSKPTKLSYPISIRKELQRARSVLGKRSLDSLYSYAVENGKRVAGSDAIIYFDKPVASLGNLASRDR